MSVHRLIPTEDRFTNRKITPANFSRGPQFVPEAPMIVDAQAEVFGPNVNTRSEGPQWQFRDGNGRIIRKADRFPDLAPPDDDDGNGIVAPLVVMCAVTFVVINLVVWGEYFLGVM